LRINPGPQVSRQRRAGTVSVSAFVVFCLLLVGPACALSQLAAQVDWRILVGAPLALSIFTFFAYRSDKRRAEAGAWRISESTLHFAELIGGWPGAFLAQRKFRHKTSKASFQVAFWFIVLAHQFVAFDSLSGWKFSKDALRLLRSRIYPVERSL
jgi:uncharacterized membrane protein YsdA (DUF1294 family)